MLRCKEGLEPLNHAGIEIGMALGKGKTIYMLKEPVGEVADYYSAIGYIAINGDLKKIK